MTTEEILDSGPMVGDEWRLGYIRKRIKAVIKSAGIVVLDGEHGRMDVRLSEYRDLAIKTIAKGGTVTRDLPNAERSNPSQGPRSATHGGAE